MSRSFKLVGGLILLVVVLAFGLWAYRSLMLFEGRSPEGYRLLTAMPGAKGFEPQTLPAGPVLDNRGSPDLDVDFGYKVGGIAYSYAVRLTFPDTGDKGHAKVTVRHATREASVEGDAIRRWDEPRKAYAVALQEKFEIQPAVPSLCIKAVVGPRTKAYDLTDASICVAQRDGAGTCHPETLACGLIR